MKALIQRILGLFRKKDVRKRTNVIKSDKDEALFAGLSPEQICGIDPERMSRDKIKKILAKLYKRHNAAVSSLNPDLRREAKQTLEAIVDCRKRYVDSADSV